jgi:sodium transport system permease protein
LHALRDIRLIAGKEILYGSRDPDVLIYGLLIPLILYPVIFIGSGEFAFWMVGQFEKRIARIGVAYTPDARYKIVKDALREVKQFKVIDSPDPDADLQSQRLDAVVVFDEKKKNRAYIRLPHANLVDKTAFMAMASILSTQQGFVDKAAEKAGINKLQLEVFRIKTVDVAPSSSRHEIVAVQDLGGLPMPVLAFISLIWVHIALCAAPPAAVMFAEEREKKTLETTLLLPPGRATIVLGKFVATWLIALGSGFMYLLGFAITFLALMFSLKVRSGKPLSLLGLLPPASVSLETWVMFAISILVSAAVVAAIYLFATAKANSFKEAQAVITVPVLVFSVIPMMAFIPGLELNALTALVPVLNVFLVLKRGEPHVLFSMISIVSMLALIAGSLYFSARSLAIRAARTQD